ncbi:ACBD6 [Bugula neritina]|uniref:Acyl-CoA-binding domain-containing protein 6 n=1 Tax=Bugula neritina TaxID=10212 RepID=A0A7J7KE32_BUGNE|nr:ACBD6 [Bugula neritina]
MTKISIPQNELLYLYSRYKQATQGPCCTPRPGILQFEGKKKWDAWKSLGAMTKQEAQSEYVAKIQELDIHWTPEADSSGSKPAAGWVSVSVMAETGDQVPDHDKDVFDWCKEGNLKRLKETLVHSSIDSQDENGLSILHWACDRGHISVVEYLLELKAQVNATDNEGQTPLHYASSCGHIDIVKLLVQHSADVSFKDVEGYTPLQCADSDDIRRFLSSC